VQKARAYPFQRGLFLSNGASPNMRPRPVSHEDKIFSESEKVGRTGCQKVCNWRDQYQFGPGGSRREKARTFQNFGGGRSPPSSQSTRLKTVKSVSYSELYRKDALKYLKPEKGGLAITANMYVSRLVQGDISTLQSPASGRKGDPRPNPYWGQRLRLLVERRCPKETATRVCRRTRLFCY